MLARKEGNLNLTKDAFKIGETEVVSLARGLHTDLDTEIFNEELVKNVELIRNVCDLKSLAVRIAARGSVFVATVSDPLFGSSAKQYYC